MKQLSEHKARIISTARGLFEKFGVRSISMDEIAKQLGVSKKTLYQHFADKDEIVAVAMKVSIQEKSDKLMELKRNESNAIVLFIQLHQNLYQDKRRTNRLLWEDLKKYHPTTWKMVQQFKDKVVMELIRSNLERGILDGYFRSDIVPEMVTKLHLETLSLCHNDEVFPKTKFDNDEIFDRILDHALLGITTESGRKYFEQYKSENKI